MMASGPGIPLKTRRDLEKMRVAARHVAEITLHIKGTSYIGVGTSNDMYTSIDDAVDRLQKQMSRKKERVKGHKGE